MKSPSSPLSNEPLTEFYKPRSVSPKLNRKESVDINEHVLENKEVVTSKREWSVEERIQWERQQLEESKKQYERSSKKNCSGKLKDPENTNSVKPQQLTEMSHREVIERNKKNLRQQGSQDTETNNIVKKDKEKDEISSRKNIMKDNTRVDNNPQPTPQISNNDKPLVNSKEVTIANTTKYGASDSIYGNSREPLSKSLSPNTDKFASFNKHHQPAEQAISGWNQRNSFDHKNTTTTTTPSSSSYNAVQVRKSFSIKSLTPKLGRRNTGARKIDENGRILDKKGCAQRNIVGLLPFPPSKDNSPTQRANLQQQQQKQQDTDDEMQTELYENNFKKSNASRDSENSWLGKSGLFDTDSSITATTPATTGDVTTTTKNLPSSKNTFKAGENSTTQSIYDKNSSNSEGNQNHGNSSHNNNNGAAIKSSVDERQHLVQEEDYEDEDESDEDAYLDRSILISDKKNRKNKNDGNKFTSSTKSKTSKLTGGLSFRKKYNFDKL